LALGVYRAQQEVLGKKILDAEKHPLIFPWVAALMELPVIKEHVHPHDKLVNFLRMFLREYPSA